MASNEIKTIYLTYRRKTQNDKGQILYEDPITVAFSYSNYLGEVPVSVLIEELDEAYNKLKERLITEDLKNGNEKIC